MSPRKNMKKAEEQHPPAPFAEDDTASQGSDEFEGLSQKVIEEYWAAYDALNNLNINDDEEQNVNDDPSEDSQSTPGGYEQEQRGEMQYLCSNGNEPPPQFRVNYRAAVQPPQCPPAQVQQIPVPIAPLPTFIFRNAANFDPRVFANAHQAQPVWYSVEGVPESIERRGRSGRNHLRLALPFHGESVQDYYPRGVVPGGYSRGVEGMPRNLFPHRSAPIMRRPNGRQDERIPLAPPRSLDRDAAPLMERDLLFEMWTDAFGASKRIEQDMAAFREKLERLYEFCYRS